MFWPESNQKRARSALRRTLSSLRRAVGAEALTADRDSVGLVADRVDVDVVRFSELIRAGSVSALRQAADLYRGDLLSGFSVRSSPEFEDWHRTESERFRREADEVFARLAQTEAADGDHAGAIRMAERRLELDPLNEPAHRLAMLTEAWAGRRSKAIERYRTAARILEEELGVAPLPETTRLYEEIRRGRVPEVPGPEQVDGPGRGPERGDRDDPPFIGRDHEVRRVVDAYRRAAYEGRTIVVEGEAGIGKSRLAREVMARVAAEGGRATLVRCHQGERDLPYAPIAGLLRDLVEAGGTAHLEGVSVEAVGALLPDLAGPGTRRAGFGEGPEGRIRFYEALTSSIGALSDSDRPALLVIEDLHFADQATVEFLGYLTRRLSRSTTALLVTWRREELPFGSPLPALAEAGSQADASVLISLERLGDEDIRRIVETVAPAIEPSARDVVVLGSDGVPLFAIEYAQAAARSDPARALPERIRNLLQGRLSRVGEVGGQVLAAAAILGRAFDPELVRAVSGRTESELAEALDEAEKLSLLERTGTGASVRYDFTHENLRRVAYESIPAGRRRLLHRRASDALSRAGRPPPALLGEAAAHAESAGSTERAAELYAAAGDAARSVHANAEAGEYYSTALALGHAETADLHEALGDLATLAGEYRRGIAEFESAAAVASGERLARLERKLGRVYSRRGDWTVASSFLEAALRAGDSAFRAAVAADLATVAHRSGDHRSAARHAGRAVELAESAGDVRSRAHAANIAGLLAREADDPDAAVELFDRSRDLAAAGGDEERVIAALNNLALVYGDMGRHDESVRLLDEAIERCRTIGDRHREAALLSNLGDAQFARGEREAAAESIKRSATILAEIGADGERRIPEVWMLREW